MATNETPTREELAMELTLLCRSFHKVVDHLPLPVRERHLLALELESLVAFAAPALPDNPDWYEKAPSSRRAVATIGVDVDLDAPGLSVSPTTPRKGD